tara:strand:+ start:166 stop:342 length:177 start_codon:yes stop_codon:yes gene_type:complete
MMGKKQDARKLRAKKERAKRRVAARRKRIREENRLQKEVDRIKWENRERIKPIRNKDK